MSEAAPELEAARPILTEGNPNETSTGDAAAQGRRRPAGAASQADRPSDICAQLLLDDARFWLTAIADSSNDAIVGKDLNGIATFWNNAAEVMFGYRADEIVGRPITCIIPPDRIDEEALILARCRRSEKIAHFETERLCKDGAVIPISLTASPIRDDRNRVIGVSEVTRDLREIKRIDSDLQCREALLRSILDTVTDALVVVDWQGLIHSFSVAAERLFGYGSEEVIGKNGSMLRSSADQEQIDSYLRRYLETAEQRIPGVGRRKDGSTFPMELIFGTANVPGSQFYTVFVRDLTEHDEREHKLPAAHAELERLARHLAKERDRATQADQAKSRFLAGMSHEMRTPLNGILGYAQLLHMEGGLSETQEARVNAMRGAGKHLLLMIEGVLDLSEIEAKRVELKFAEVELGLVMEACLDLVRPMAEAKRLTLGLSIAPDVPGVIKTDPTRLRQMLLNLLGNAAKFTHQGGVELRVRTVADGASLRLEVADTGPGIPAEKHCLPFQQFGRLDTGGTGIEGAGLGLSLSEQLATLMGGCVGYDNNPDGGSVFWLEIPLDALSSSVPTRVPASDCPDAPPVRVLHVLVVDDMLMNRDIASSFLRAAGHTTTCVESGLEAVTAAAVTDFDVVLMDVRMPGIDGLEATRRIRALEGARGRVPIVALTAQAFRDQVEECIKAGMGSYLSKPFDLATLLATVISAAGAGRPHGENLRPVPASAAPVIGAELPVFNLHTFDCTARHLRPEAVAGYLQTIVRDGEALLRGLREAKTQMRTRNALADAAHTLAGGAGMFGFERLAALGRRFERALQTGAADAPVLADALIATIEAMLLIIRDRTALTVET